MGFHFTGYVVCFATSDCKDFRTKNGRRTCRYELDDETEKVVTPAGSYYIVELEMDGKPDIQVEIKEDGTLRQ